MTVAKKNVIEIIIQALDKSGPGLEKAGKRMEKFGKSAQAMAKKMAVAGGAITAALGVIIKKAAAAGDELDKLAIRTGVMVADLSRLKFAAELAGSSMGGVAAGFKRLAVTQKDAQDKLAESVRVFEDLDVEFQDSEGNLRPLLDVFLEISDALVGLGNTTEAAALAQKALGRGGVDLLPLLLQGRDSIKEVMEQSDALGLTWDRLAVDNARDVTDALTTVKFSMSAVNREILNALTPGLLSLTSILSEKVIPKVAEFTREHEKLVVTLGAVGLGLTGGAGLIATVGLLALAFNQATKAVITLNKAVKALVASTAFRAVLAFMATAGGIALLAGGAVVINVVTQEMGRKERETERRKQEAKRAATSTPFLRETQEEITALAMGAEEGEKPFSRLAELMGQVRKESGGARVNIRSMLSLIRGLPAAGVRRPKAEAEPFVSTVFEQTPEQRRTALLETVSGLIEEVEEAEVALTGVFDGIPELAERAFQGATQPVITWVDMIMGAVDGIAQGVGTVVAGVFERLLGGGGAMADVQRQMDELQLRLQLAQGPAEEEALKKRMEEARREMSRLRLEALQTGSVLKDLGSVFVSVFADIIRQITAAIVKLLVFKLILSALGFGSVAGDLSILDILGIKPKGGRQGMLVPGLQSGALVRQGIPGVDSVLARLGPGEAVLTSRGPWSRFTPVYSWGPRRRPRRPPVSSPGPRIST
jgi:hypothetical protein